MGLDGSHSEKYSGEWRGYQTKRAQEGQCHVFLGQGEMSNKRLFEHPVSKSSFEYENVTTNRITYWKTLE